MNEDLGQSLMLKIYSLAKTGFGIRFEDYLKKNKNRAFWGITIENEKFEHNPLFGNPDPRFLKIANDAFKSARKQSEAGYKVDLGSVPFFKELGVNADVFLINPERLMDDRLDLDALIFHELCHGY